MGAAIELIFSILLEIFCGLFDWVRASDDRNSRGCLIWLIVIMAIVAVIWYIV